MKGVGGLLLFLGFLLLPIMPDPYYHEENVPLIVWVGREINEIIYGER